MGSLVGRRRPGSRVAATVAVWTAGWAKAWSPEQISNRLRVDFPDDETVRVSAEAAYQSLFIEGRGARQRELVACLRTGRALGDPTCFVLSDGGVARETINSCSPSVMSGGPALVNQHGALLGPVQWGETSSSSPPR